MQRGNNSNGFTYLRLFFAFLPDFLESEPYSLENGGKNLACSVGAPSVQNRPCMNRGVVVTEAGSYLRRIDSCITQLRLKVLRGPVTRVKKKNRN